jgi:hypothetical protein
VFHVQLRQFPNQTRLFNLSREELETRLLRPWLAGRAVELNERLWTPEKAKLSIYEGPRLAVEEIGLGRGWANVTRSGEEVTERLLGEARAPRTIEAFKAQIAEACMSQPIPIAHVVELAAQLEPGALASEHLARAERAVWELLHAGEVTLLREHDVVPREDWREALLSWANWSEQGVELARRHPE